MVDRVRRLGEYGTRSTVFRTSYWNSDVDVVVVEEAEATNHCSSNMVWAMELDLEICILAQGMERTVGSHSRKHLELAHPVSDYVRS